MATLFQCDRCGATAPKYEKGQYEVILRESEGDVGAEMWEACAKCSSLVQHLMRATHLDSKALAE